MPDLDVELTGFDLPEIENLVADTLNSLDSEEDFDVDAELAKDLPTITKPGDVIELGMHGEHRLICSDVTKTSDVIAAARLGRRCFGMEIEPKYCDIIVRRYIATAGKDSVSEKIAKR